jgi:hypothetical protein
VTFFEFDPGSIPAKFVFADFSRFPRKGARE